MQLFSLCWFCRTMLVDRGLCRRSGRPLLKLLWSVSLPNNFPSMFCRMFSPCSHQRAAMPQKPCSTVSSPLSGRKTNKIISYTTEAKSQPGLLKLYFMHLFPPQQHDFMMSNDEYHCTLDFFIVTEKYLYIKCI